MTVVYPEGTPTLGNTKLKAVAAVADPTSVSLATELDAVSSVDVSGYMYPAGWNPGANTAKGTKPARLASTVQQEVLNRTTFTLADLQYVYDPQGADGDPGNEAKALLAEGTEVYLVERIGIDADTDFTVGDQIVVHHVRLGAQVKSGDRTDENGEFYIMQAIAYVGTGPVDGVVVA